MPGSKVGGISPAGKSSGGLPGSINKLQHSIGNKLPTSSLLSKKPTATSTTTTTKIHKQVTTITQHSPTDDDDSSDKHVSKKAKYSSDKGNNDSMIDKHVVKSAITGIKVNKTNLLPKSKTGGVKPTILTPKKK